ncbi:MAG: hypothetical protein Q8W45_02835 [Candidatus Palauibacterales bacterium]|jgi:hypothetical protein|nr:hypothetical protein [Candidatus Palauibacterales bacterium]MDP2482193.1 hypothetical protein [Candidatus Palauibacterales bacterium]
MTRRKMAVFGLLGSVVALGATARPSSAAEKSWCMTYCDAIHVGCKKTLGWLDDDACEEWHEGCLDGCRVND